MANHPFSAVQAKKLGQIGAVVSVAANLIWVAQAWVIASALSALLIATGQVGWMTAAALLGLGVLRAVLSRVALATLSTAAETEIQTLRHEIIAHEAATIVPSQVGGAGAIASLMTEKLEALRPYLLRYKPARMRVMVVPIVIVAITAWYSWAAAVVLLAAGPLIPVFMALVGWAAKAASEKQMVEIGSLNDLLADRLAALSDLALIGAGPQVIAGFATASDRLRDRTMAVLRIAFLSSTVLEFFSALGVAMIAVWVGFALLGEIGWGTWGTTLSPFAGIFMLLLAPDFFQPLRDLAAAWHDKSAADAVSQEMDTWRADARRPMLGQGAAAKPLAFTGLAVHGVSVVHDDRTLRFPDLHVRPGDSVALSGPSGVGKTTLLRLLACLDAPTAGDILIGQTRLTDQTADAWRASIGWMPQTPRFQGRSLRYNIAFGGTLDRDVLQVTQVAPVIETLPAQDLTPLGETGAGLSGGEARRVMLARALQGRPRLVLADEPTADLDAKTAQAITDALLGYVANGGTLIVATHDPKLIARMQTHIPLEARL